MVIGSYPIEEIPSDSFVFRRIAKTLFDDPKEVPTSAFSSGKSGKGISVNWDRHRNALETKNQQGRSESVQVDVAKLNVGVIRNYTDGLVINESLSPEQILGVEHDPEPNQQNPKSDNQSHSLITGAKERSPSQRRRIRQFLSLESELIEF